MTWKTCKLHGDDKPGVWGCPECLRELREENKRMRDRIERLRGALKTASGRFLDAGHLVSANDCLQWAGDMEPPIMGSNAQGNRRSAGPIGGASGSPMS